MSTVKVGAQIAGVRIDELVAHTSTSEVYRGTDLATGLDTAVKVLAHPDESAGRRLRREAALLQQVDHPLIVPFHSLEQSDEDLVLVTNWVTGSSLRDQIRSDPNRAAASEDAAVGGLALLQNLADPLDYLHQRGIVHRDISPGNIIMSAEQTPVLVDLGIGHTIGTATLTNHDLMAGTPKYLAPEIIRGESATGQSDQYSLAVVVYEWIAGRSPFPPSDELATALHHQLHTEPEPLIEIAPRVPAPLSAAIMRALAKDPTDRFSSVTEFADAAHADNVEAPTRAWLRPTAAVAVVLATMALLAVLGWPDGEQAETAPVPVAAEVPAAGVAEAAEVPAAGVAEVTEVPAAGVAEVPAAGVAEVAEVPAAGVAEVPAAGVARVTEVPAAAVTEVDPDWPVGAAALVACNELMGRDFESGTLPLDYFSKPPGRERVVEGGGYGDTWALELGLANEFSQFGEMIPITPGEQYLFRGWFKPVGEVGVAELGITLLDANSDGLDITSAEPISLDAAGFAQVRIDNIPDEAVFAVPYLYKDSSPGIMLADELVFGLDAVCGPQIAAMVDDS